MTMSRDELAVRAGYRPDAIAAARLVESTRDVAVGDRLLVEIAHAAPDRDPDASAPMVPTVVEVVELTVMGCGCSRARFPRPGGGRVAVYSTGCRWAQDTVDFAAARDAVAS